VAFPAGKLMGGLILLWIGAQKGCALTSRWCIFK